MMNKMFGGGGVVVLASLLGVAAADHAPRQQSDTSSKNDERSCALKEEREREDRDCSISIVLGSLNNKIRMSSSLNLFSLFSSGILSIEELVFL